MQSGRGCEVKAVQDAYRPGDELLMGIALRQLLGSPSALTWQDIKHTSHLLQAAVVEDAHAQ